jgi:hypothetical protein
VQSGQQRGFLDLDEMLRFLQQMGITVAQPADHDGYRMPIPPSGSRRFAEVGHGRKERR